MLRIFFIGIFGLSAGIAFANEDNQDNCLNDLISGKIPLRAKNIVECSEKLQATQEAALSQAKTSLEKEIADGDSATLEAAKKILEELNPDNANQSLSKSFDERSALAQIQAQASCTAISFSAQSFAKYIRAVARPQLTPQGQPASGNGDVVTCDTICSELEPPRANRDTGSCIAALHIYGGLDPLVASEDDFSPVGDRKVFTKNPSTSLMTHVYGPAGGCGHEHFGPNFCCCSN